MQDSVLVPDPGKPLTQVHLLFYNTDSGVISSQFNPVLSNSSLWWTLSRAYR